MANFTSSIENWSKKAKGNIDRDVRGITMGLFSRIVLDSPVGNPTLWKHPAPKGYVGGAFRAAWNVSIGSPDYTTTDAKDKAGLVTIARGKKNVGGAGTVTYISNGLPYGPRLEFEGWSKQAPMGFCRINVAKVAELAKAEKAL